MSSEWDSDSPSPHEQTLESSTSRIPMEREDRPIQNGQTDHLRVQVAVKRGTLLSGETKDDEVHQGSDACGVFKSRIVGESKGFVDVVVVCVCVCVCVYFIKSYDVTIFKMGRDTKIRLGCKEKKLGVRNRSTETFCQR